MRALAISLLVLTLAGCASKLQVTESADPVGARFARLGVSAFGEGDLKQAREYFEQALARAVSIEDADGIFSGTLNLVRLYREQGDATKALQLIQGFPEWCRGSLRRDQSDKLDIALSLALADAGQREAATARLDSQLSACAQCALELQLTSLRARLLLEAGDAAQARILAGAYLQRRGDTSRSAEAANIWRTLGEAELSLGNAQPASTAFAKALEIDRAIRASSRIALDLDGLARASAKADDATGAAAFAQRRDAVRTALGILAAPAANPPHDP